MDSFTPQQTIELVARTGCKKAHMRLDKLFINSCMAGPLLGFGCAVLVSVNASPWYQTNAPGLIRFIGALLFPIGLVMIVLSGADLFTSNVMYMLTAFLSRRISIKPLLISWFVSFFGNLAGMLFFVTIIMGYGGVFDESAEYSEAAIRIAVQKAVKPQWHQIFLRAIGANWLVCFAVYSSIQGRDLVSKIVAIWWPTCTFVALALDHVIANMFFIPMGMWVGAPISASFYIWKSLIPTLLGNIVGGGLFVGAVYWYLYLTGEAGVQVAFGIGAAESAVEGGVGPMRLSGRDQSQGKHTGHPAIIDGVPVPGSGLASPGPTTPGVGIGMGGGHLVSAVGHELGDHSNYAKTLDERRRSDVTKSSPDGSDGSDEKV